MILITVEHMLYPTPILHLAREIEALGHEAVILDTDGFRQRRFQVTLTWEEGPVTGTLQVDGRTIPLADIHSAFFWRGWFASIGSDDPERRLPAAALQFYQDQWFRFWEGLGLLLVNSNVFCVNPFPNNLAYQEKICQFELARHLGFSVPPTCITTDLAVARAFFEAQEGDVIYKVLAPALVARKTADERPKRFATVYTNRVRAEDLREGENYMPSPCLFQRRIPKKTEVRAVVLGDHVFAVEIDAQSSPKASLDWRRYDWEHTAYRRHALPGDVARRLIALTARLGLVYSAIDLILTPEGEYIFLETNPNGQYYWLEQLTGVPLTRNLARMLVAASRTYEPWYDEEAVEA